MERNHLGVFIAFTIGMVAGLFLATRGKRQAKLAVEKDTQDGKVVGSIGRERKAAS